MSFFFFFQCGLGSTDDELNPTCVSSLLGIRIERVAAGLWHTVCVSADGDVYAFGGNQFGQLGTGGDQAEVFYNITFSMRWHCVLSVITGLKLQICSIICYC